MILGPRRLVLFDVDGTLLSAGRAFVRAMSDALRATFGATGPMETFDYSGKTDPQIVRELMRDAGVPEEDIQNRLRDALDRYVDGLTRGLSPQDVTAKPGVHRVLEALCADSTVTLALLTGNLEPGARAKLAPIGLNRFFPFGAFGSDHEDRARLAALAVERALAATGHRFAGKQIVVIGDSVHDVRCGRGLGVRAVAVATGRTPSAVLAAEAPDALLADLSDTERTLTAIFG